jgi:hypothetical protein
MESIPLTIIVYMKSFVEFASYLIIAQGLTYLLCFGKHNSNLVYKIFYFLTKPLFKFVKFALPHSVGENHTPYITLLLLLIMWLFLVVGKFLFVIP